MGDYLMSHNQVKVNSQEPNRQGTVTQSVSDLSDVTITTPSDNQVLKYNSTSSIWENSGQAFTLGSVFCGEGASQAYSGSGASGVASGDTVEFYASSPHNSLSATITSASNWVSQITVGVGTYKVSALVALTFSSAGSGQFRIYSGGTATGSTGTYAQDDEDCTSIATAVIVVSSGTAAIDVRLSNTATNINTVANQGNRQAELGYFIIDRLA
jgi:hypothetical protein